MKTIVYRSKLVRLAGVCALAGVAGFVPRPAAADITYGALTWDPYFRGGPGATTVRNESRQCYGLAGPGLKYRLGNECDFYGELGLYEKIKSDNLDLKVYVMSNYYSAATESNDNYGIEQAYVEMKGVDFAPNALFWAGKRRDRNDVYIVDTFFVNMSGVGAGVEKIDLGPGSIGFAGYKMDTQVQRDNRGQLIPFNPSTGQGSVNGGGHLHINYEWKLDPRQWMRLITTYTRTDSQGNIPSNEGHGVSLEHDYAGFLGGKNHIWVQYAQGATALNQGLGTLTAPQTDTKYRIVESPSWQFGRFGGMGIAMVQRNTYDGGHYTAYSLGGRGSYAISQNVKWLTEIGHSETHTTDSDTQQLTKLTVGPALAPNMKFLSLPELRLYATYAWFNQAAAVAPYNNLPIDRRNGFSYGAQVEIWFQ